jgi:prepilin-type N-terminal cleavage/methylation domain-containing protein
MFRSDSSRTTTPRRRAFTLVELLAVIGIIALLLAILLPALAGARTAAKRTATEALMREVLSASQSFQSTNGRPPGFFSATDVGGRTNRQDRGFTAMENMILDLAGGVVPPNDARASESPEADNSLIRVGPFATADENVLVDVADIGAQDGPGYLSLPQSELRPIAGQFSPIDETDWYNDRGEIVKGMPDVVDSFGQPILAWVQDPAAPLNPPASAGANPYDYFAQEEFVPSDNNRAPFYWASNAGYLTSGVAYSASPDDTKPWTFGLGEAPNGVNQTQRSMLGEIDIDEQQRIASLAGILGSPAFPVERESATDPWRPARPRGSLVLTSAGADSIYFRRPIESAGPNSAGGGDADLNVVGYAPTGQQAFVDSKVVRTVDDADDIIQSSGG